MKHKFIAKRYWKDQSTAMGQSDVLAKSFDDVIDLSLGDPDLTAAPLRKTFNVVPVNTNVRFIHSPI